MPAQSDEVTVVRDTVRGLLKLQRLVPILLVCAPLLFAQHHLSHPRPAFALGFALCLAFVFIAPVSWRLLSPDGISGVASLVRLALYAAVGAGTVLSIGFVVPRLLGIGVTFMTAKSSLIICMALFLVGGWGLGRDIGFERRLSRERIRADAMAREAERAQLLALRAHLDPHFLFNTLGCIAEWCCEDGAVAERAVLELAAILRTVLEGVKATLWPLRREIELVRTVFALHGLRDPQAFVITINVSPEVAEVPVPPLVLLPLAENAVTHGPAAGHHGAITLAAHAQADRLMVELTNPGRYQGRRPEGSGLSTVEQRLALAYGDAATLEISPQGERTRVLVSLPLSRPDPTVVT